MNEIVKYHNDMNSVNFQSFNAVELDLLLSLCAKVRDEGLQTLTYDFEQLRDLSKYKPTANKRFIADLQQVNRKLLSLNFTIRTSSKIIQFVLFKKFEIDLDTNELKISVNEEFSYILNELTANFTRFELHEFVSLQSKYAKNLYRLLKQYRSTGEVYFTMDDFRSKLDIPPSYHLCDISRKVLEPIQKELTPLFDDLEIKKVKNMKKRGHPVTHINFRFSPQKISQGKVSQSKEDTELELVRQVYLPDFTLEEIQSLLRYGSLEQLKQASKRYDYYKQDNPIDHKMGFMVDMLKKMNPPHQERVEKTKEAEEAETVEEKFKAMIRDLFYRL